MRVRACVFVTTKNGTRNASICRVKTNSKFEPPALNNLVIENDLTNAKKLTMRRKFHKYVGLLK